MFDSIRFAYSHRTLTVSMVALETPPDCISNQETWVSFFIRFLASCTSHSEYVYIMLFNADLSRFTCQVPYWKPIFSLFDFVTAIPCPATTTPTKACRGISQCSKTASSTNQHYCSYSIKNQRGVSKRVHSLTVLSTKKL